MARCCCTINAAKLCTRNAATRRREILEKFARPAVDHCKLYLQIEANSQLCCSDNSKVQKNHNYYFVFALHGSSNKTMKLSDFQFAQVAFHQHVGLSFDQAGSEVDPIKKSARLPLNFPNSPSLYESLSLCISQTSI